jgi:hypothetical protein
MPMSSGLTSSLSDLPKGRSAAEPSNRPPRYRIVRNLLATARLRLGKLVSSAVARGLLIFFVGFAAGGAWQSYGGEARKAVAGWSPHLAWVAPADAPGGTSADRFKAMSLALTTARQSLDRLATEISKAQAQDIGKPQAQDGAAPKRKR